jgi:hypothetical protein
MKKLLLGVMAAAAIVVAHAQAPSPDDAIARIKMEGFQRSQVMETLSWLSDVYGPRLTGSAGLRRAAEWARDELAGWGLEHAALENYGRSVRGWDVQRFSIEMTEPQYVRLVGYPRAWSPATASPITGTPIVVDVKSKSDFDKYRGKLRGAIVMNGRPSASDIGFQPEATRLTDDELKKQESAIDPSSDGKGPGGAPSSYWDEEDEWTKALAEATEIYKFFAAEGVRALVTPSPIAEAVGVSGFYDDAWRPTYPGFVLAREQYGRIVRMLDKKQPVKLSLSLEVRVTDNVEGFNVVADIPGTDPALKDQIVMLGGHFDSWHAGTGATDNGAGSAAAMEAVRILKAIGVKPRRTIRVALWTGEEEDYFGSLGYVKQHFGDPASMALKPEHAKLSAYFNLDNGAGRIRGINLQGNEAARPIFEAWLRPFNYLGATTVTTLNTGGTDHMPFDAVGLPGFQFMVDRLEYNSRTHHSNMDTFDRVQSADMIQQATVVAVFAYNAAMRDEKLPRKPLPASTPAGRGGDAR